MKTGHYQEADPHDRAPPSMGATSRNRPHGHDDRGCMSTPADSPLSPEARTLINRMIRSAYQCAQHEHGSAQIFAMEENPRANMHAAETALESYISRLEGDRNAATSTIAQVCEEIDDYGQEVREDWSGFDGRTCRYILNGFTQRIRAALPSSPTSPAGDASE